MDREWAKAQPVKKAGDDGRHEHSIQAINHIGTVSAICISEAIEYIKHRQKDFS